MFEVVEDSIVLLDITANFLIDLFLVPCVTEVTQFAMYFPERIQISFEDILDLVQCILDSFSEFHDFLVMKCQEMLLFLLDFEVA